MFNNVYTLYNNLSKRYGDVVAFPSDAFAVARISEGLNQNRSEFELCRIGQIDIDTGCITPCSPVRIALPDLPDNLPVREA